MTAAAESTRRVAIACGGTGGHLFPGLAVADELLRRGCRVTLLISPKDVDQQALKGVTGVEVVTLPAVGLVRGGTLDFLRGSRASYHLAKLEFNRRPPLAALAMGGFTSGPPILAARQVGARTFLHESNTVPGRANRWLSWIVDAAFVGFPSTGRRLHSRRVKVTGTPVRSHLGSRQSAACRAAFGLDPARPVILVMGGSQGAHGVNELVAKTVPLAARTSPEWQWLHLSGEADLEPVKQAYAAARVSAVVQAFCGQMDLALGAATAAISRAGASSLAELAELRLPAVLIPYPAATHNHQYHNARFFEERGAAILLPQAAATPQQLSEALRRVASGGNERDKIRTALEALRTPMAAQEIAETVLAEVSSTRGESSESSYALCAASNDSASSSRDDASLRNALQTTTPTRAPSMT